MWPSCFFEVASRLKNALGDDVIAIHHIGSTSITSLAAKNVIDIQITVMEFKPEIIEKISFSGFEQLFYNDHLPAGNNLESHHFEKQFFIGRDPAVHIHVRKLGLYNQRYALLCRDFLRNNNSASKAYEQVKKELAKYFPYDLEAYYAIKDPVFDLIISGAEIWAKQTSWTQPNPDV